MDLRRLTTADRAAATTLWATCGLTRPWNDPAADFDRAAARTTSDVLGGFDSDALVATAMVGHDGHRAWMYYVAVDPAHRRKGHGVEMVRACEEWAVDRGMPKVQLMVRGDNETAAEFYEALGYELQDTVVYGRRVDS